jgi:hypothetical protein
VTETRPGVQRDLLIDTVRALSLLMVVVWHWVFTVLIWEADGPHATNPIGVTRGLWIITWLLQVMPLFFFAGGYVHSKSWARDAEGEGGGATWVVRRLRSLLLPALSLVALGGLAYLIGRSIAPDARWLGRGVVLMLSPLWFLIVYAMLVACMPLWRWLHERLGEVALVLMVGIAVVVDVFRFSYDWAGVEWFNFLIVWSISHQLGFHYERLVAAPKRFAWCLALGGGFALFGLTNMGLYPRSMVGVPGEAISNMAPPTLAIAALTIFQIGVILLAREKIIEWAKGPVGSKVVAIASKNAMPIFLWHAPGFALAYGLWRLWDLPGQSGAIDAAWWAWRPLWLVLPIVPTIVLGLTLGRLTLRKAYGLLTRIALPADA